ncbi:MAG: energy-coupling factor transporter transmembrane protein EcfT [Clostridia bacterium]|nr:energy-coupling factor transporter transmembrane protein EcfT [Clostridia bacterium]
MKTIYNLHPFVSFLYYLLVIVFSVCIMHPVCILLSVFGSVLLSVKLSGKKMLKFYLMFILPTAILAAVLNPLFNHQGVTILAYFPNGNPLTKESLLYGFAASGMIASVMSWFYSFNLIITSDKIVYLFGKITPSLSLLISMILRFVPNFKRQIEEIAVAQKGMGIYKQNKLKAVLSVLSAEITVALESAVVTSDSMKSRGYGTAKRTFYSNYTLRKFDVIFLLVISALGLINIALWSGGAFKSSFYPVITISDMPALSVILYGIFCLLPFILESVEEIRWNVLKSKI